MKLSKMLLSVLLVSNLAFAGNIELQTQGSFFVGGKVLKTQGVYNSKDWLNQQGQTRHADHAYVAYQIPVKAHKYPVVFLHGAWQSGKTWESTPDGRDGFSNLFLKQHYSTYIVDQPRRGRASQASVEANINPTTLDQFCFDIFRIGLYPNYYDNVQFPKGEETLEQFFRQSVPDVGKYDADVISEPLKVLFNKIGDGILISHSQGGESGWLTVIKSPKVKAVVSIEPGSGFVFPKGYVPDAITTSAGTLAPVTISMDDFKALTKLPILILYGDNIPLEPTGIPGKDNWYMRLVMAKKWVQTINQFGGNAKVIHLPEIGIKGNTHFMFADLNNEQIANLIFEYFEYENLN